METPSDLKKTADRLDKELSSVSRSVRFVRFLHGLGELLVAFFFFFLFSFLADFLIPDLPAAVRIVITACGAVGLSYLLWRSVLRPLFHQLTKQDVAAELEDAYPELNDRLISALELSRRYGDQDRMSNGLIEQLVDDLDSVIDRVRPGVIVSIRPMLKRFGTGLFCTALFGLFLVSFPEEASTWLVRLTGSNQNWPQATRITLANSPTSEVVEGNDVRIRAVVNPESKRTPSTASLRIFEKNGPARTIEMTVRSTSSGKSTYEHTVQNIREPFEYVVNAGDGQTSRGSVTVLNRPRIAELKIRYDYPEYTNKSDTPDDQPVTGRELTAPFDTIAEVHAPVPGNVTTVRAYFESGQKKQDVPVSLSTSEDGQQMLRTELTMRENGKLFFELFMKNVEELPDSPCSSPASVCSSRFSVRTRTNQPPQVRVTYPGKNKFATPRGTIPIRSTTTDDYGIRSISLSRRINDSDPEAIPFTSEHNNREYGESTIKSEYQLAMKDLEASDGDTVYYSVSAKDVGREEAEPSKTKTYRLSIISPSRMEVKLQKLQEEIRERISNLRSDQSKANSQLSYHIEEGSSSGSDHSDQELGKRRNQQRSLAQRLQRVTRELKRMERDARFNQLWDQKSRSALASIHQHARRIHSDLTSTAATSIARAIAAANAQKRNQRVNEALDLQRETMNELDALLNRMGSWYDYADIIHEWEQILESLQQVQDNNSSDTPG